MDLPINEDLIKKRNLHLQSWTRTEVKKYCIEHKWSIDNLYSLFDETVSNNFFLESQQFQTDAFDFQLQFYPKWKSAPGFVIINLIVAPLDVTFREIKSITRHKLSIVDKDGEYFNVNDVYGDHSDENFGHVFGYKIPFECLSDADYGLVPEDQLTIHCEVTYVGGKLISTGKLGEGSEHLLELGERQIVDDLANLWDCGKFTDFSIRFGEGKNRLRAHKAILAARSPVFQAMFDHETEEKQENRLDITDSTSEVFEEFLKYIYTGKLEQLDKFAEELLKISDKYQVNSLKVICDSFLCTKLSPQTVPNLLLIADFFNADKLKNATLEFIKNNAKDTIEFLIDGKQSEQLVKLFRQMSIEKNE